MDTSDSGDALIKKQMIHSGSKYIPLVDGTKVRFHYQTKTCPEKGEQVLLDDSKKNHRPMELIIGKKFKFEVWEAIVKKMSLNEVAKFRVDKSVMRGPIEKIETYRMYFKTFLFILFHAAGSAVSICS